MHDIDALDLEEKLSFHQFAYNQSSSMKWIVVVISIPFCYWHDNHILHIKIRDIDALDLQEKLSF